MVAQQSNPLQWVITLGLRDRDSPGWTSSPLHRECIDQRPRGPRERLLVPGDIPGPSAEPARDSTVHPHPESHCSVRKANSPFHLYWDVQFSVGYSEQTSTQRRKSTVGKRNQKLILSYCTRENLTLDPHVVCHHLLFLLLSDLCQAAAQGCFNHQLSRVMTALRTSKKSKRRVAVTSDKGSMFSICANQRQPWFKPWGWNWEREAWSWFDFILFTDLNSQCYHPAITKWTWTHRLCNPSIGHSGEMTQARRILC